MKRISKNLRSGLITIFSFLLGCMFTLNITPIDRTCRIEDTDKEYNIMKNSKLKNPDLVILILSAPKNVDKRNTIRDTWLKFYFSNHENDDHDQFTIKHYFVIGNSGLGVEISTSLNSEQSKFGDILLLPILDSYRNLTEKVKSSFEWLNDQYNFGLGFEYVLKCDDDSFVLIERLASKLSNIVTLYLKPDLQTALKLISDNTNSFLSFNVQTNEKTSTKNSLNLYWGYFSGSSRIKSKGKWKEKDWITSDRYVPYALGGGYLLSKGLISFIAKNAENLRSFNSEDVSVGLWLAPVNNILRIHDSRFDTEWTSRGCLNSHLITHNLSPNEMKQLYNNLMGSRKLCAEEIKRRGYYVYDWGVAPSQCCKTADENVIRLQKH